MGERPAKAVHTVLSAAAALSGETIRIGKPQDTPDRGLWVSATGGPRPSPLQSSDGDYQETLTVQVLCRAKQGDDAALETLSWAVFSALKDAAEPTDYISVTPSPPIPMLEDARGRPRASVNVELVIIE